jgi:hypothetical protein
MSQIPDVSLASTRRQLWRIAVTSYLDAGHLAARGLALQLAKRARVETYLAAGHVAVHIAPNTGSHGTTAAQPADWRGNSLNSKAD